MQLHGSEPSNREAEKAMLNAGYFSHLVSALPWIRIEDSAKVQLFEALNDAADYLVSRGFPDEDAIVKRAGGIFDHACGHFRSWGVMDEAHVDADRRWYPVDRVDWRYGLPAPAWLRPMKEALAGATVGSELLGMAIGEYFAGLAELEVPADDWYHS